jgi:hypothetical protein
VASDDEIIESYERELDGEVLERPTSNRRFWLVLGAIGVASAIMIVEIFANLGLKESIAHAQDSLRQAQAQAQAIRTRAGTFTAAGAEAMAADPGRFTFLGPAEPSAGLDQISVAAEVNDWAAAVQVRPGACFYLHLSGDEVLYGTGTECTGTVAIAASDERW